MYLFLIYIVTISSILDLVYLNEDISNFTTSSNLRKLSEHRNSDKANDHVEYKDNPFEGWSPEESKIILAGRPRPALFGSAPKEPEMTLRPEINWAHTACDYGVRYQGKCGNCWAFATAAMLGERCCLQGYNYGWLSAQELVSCSGMGCSNGSPQSAMDYIIQAGGLVPEYQYEFIGQEEECPSDYQTINQWQSAHVCGCTGGYTACKTVDEMKLCLMSGPITATIIACPSLKNYKSGIYRCDCDEAPIHTVEVMGFSEKPECHFHAKNSWGTDWGMGGYFDIACDTCGINGRFLYGSVACLNIGK